MAKFSGPSVAPGGGIDATPVEQLQGQTPQSSIISEMVAKQVASQQPAGPATADELQQELGAPTTTTPEKLMT